MLKLVTNFQSNSLLPTNPQADLFARVIREERIVTSSARSLINNHNEMKDLIDKYVGKKGTVFAGGMKVEVTVNDVKLSYGKERYLVTPVAGSGEVWVEAVTLIK